MSLNKPVERCLLTHAHFDHFLGVSQWKNACSVYALQETIDQMRNLASTTDYQFTSAVSDILTYIQPLSSLNPVLIDNVCFLFERFQNAENNFTLTVSLPLQSTVFTADIILNKKHLYLPETRDYSVYIAVVRSFQQRYPYRNVLVGHGKPSDASVYQEVIDYLDLVRNVVAVNYKKADEYTAFLTNRYPSYDNTFVVDCPFKNPNCTLGILF